jgi:hypothetical protein
MPSEPLKYDFLRGFQWLIAEKIHALSGITTGVGVRVGVAPRKSGSVWIVPNRSSPFHPEQNLHQPPLP